MKIITYKIKKTKLVTDILGYAIGSVASGVMMLASYHFIQYGGIILREPNKAIGILEFIAATFGTSYFTYRIAKLLTNKELDTYLGEKKTKK